MPKRPLSKQQIADATLNELRARCATIPLELLPTVIPLLEADSREGTTLLAATLTRRWRTHVTRQQEYESRWQHEDHARALGYRAVAGVDEAGRGPLAGPVVAAAVILPRDLHLPALNDSKAIAPELREELDAQLRHEALAFGIGEVDVDYIDEYNILQASFEAMRSALVDLPTADFLLVDGHLPIPELELPQQAVIDGDALSNSIAAASILAKVHRDRRMVKYDEVFPQYGFASHKGYCTPEHLEALRLHGRCPIHRYSFQHVITKNELGRWGEEQAVQYLANSGYVNVCTNYRGRDGTEADIVCLDGDTLVFVEVRSGRPGRPPEELLSSIDLEKQARVVQAARHYLSEHEFDGPVRFDAVAVGAQILRDDRVETWVPHVLHVPDAFRSTAL